MLPDGAVWCRASWMTRDELLELVARLRCAPVGRARLRAPHKPLLLMWLFGRFAATGSTVTPTRRLGLAGQVGEYVLQPGQGVVDPGQGEWVGGRERGGLLFLA